MIAATARLTAAGIHGLAHAWRVLDGEALVSSVLESAPALRVAAVTSFGIESAVLLDMVARLDRALPVVFVDTGRLFPETLAYRDILVERLGLTGVRTVAADGARVARVDPDETLHRTDPDACCRVRKVEPYAGSLAAFDVQITGRKRFQGGARGTLEPVEVAGDKVKVNPLAHWSETDIDAAFDRRGLPRHPLYFDGYDSVGCAACTRRRGPGEAPRAGRWANSGKTECGIHVAPCGGAAAALHGFQQYNPFHELEEEIAP